MNKRPLPISEIPRNSPPSLIFRLPKLRFHPAHRRYAGLRRPNTIPARVSVAFVAAAIRRALFVRNKTISLGSQRIDLKQVCIAAVVRRVDYNLKTVIELLTHVPA